MPAAVYRPAIFWQAVQQPDGKQLLLSEDLVRANSSPTTGLTRLLAGSSLPDQAFQSNVSGLQGVCLLFTLMPNGQVVLVSDGALTLGGVTRQRLLRLNADGTPDAGFNAGAGAGFSNFTYLLPQPDGKLLVAGDFVQFNGQPAPGLVRLNADGSLDSAFQAALGSGPGPIGRIIALALQADGKLMVGGGFSSMNGVARQAVARLLPSGALDVSFAAPVPAGVYIASIAIQPDGKVLVGGSSDAASGWRTLTRLEANGAQDLSFQTGTAFSQALIDIYFPSITVQPDGRILVQHRTSAFNGTPVGQLVRLLPGGALDPAFDNTTAVPGLFTLRSVQLLPTGKLLVSTQAPTQFAPLGSLATSLAVLNADGSREPAFAPSLQAFGRVRAVVRQADGHYVVGGDFTEIGGVTAGYLARLQANGTPDALYTAAARASDEVKALVLQPDGKVVVGGLFTQLAGGPRIALGRLLSSGALDTGFVPPLIAVPFGSARVNLLALQTDGRVLATGVLTEAIAPTTYSTTVWCFNGVTGQRDRSFPSLYNAYDMLVQPDGNIVVAGLYRVGGTSYPLFRLLPSGAPDPAFMLTAPIGSSQANANYIARDAAGLLYAVGSFPSYGSLPPANVLRLLPNGTPDPSYSALLPGIRSFTALAMQPNNRLLMGITLSTGSGAGTLRLLPTAVPDASYSSASGPASEVNALLVQPDGAIVAAGSFATVSGLPINGIVRLLDANVLSVAAQQLAIRTQAWPVPAHGQLHLALDASSNPQSVELIDALGRVVLARPTPQPELTLDITSLLPGVYTLRAHYATKWVMRRIAVK